MSFDTIAVIFIIVSCVCCGYFTYRIRWVYENLSTLIHSNRDHEYLDYDSMLFLKFWVWDINKLKKGK